jgi:hypothetical protein
MRLQKTRQRGGAIQAGDTAKTPVEINLFEVDDWNRCAGSALYDR